MSKEFLAGRERALEDEFFYQVDQKLKQQLKAKIEREKNRQQLAKETGIKDEAVLNELAELDITPETLMALSLVPLVQVAWADRVIEAKERSAVLQAVEQQGHTPESACYRLLEHWLNAHPGEKVVRAWKDYVGALARTMKPERLTALRDDLLTQAREVAEAAGGILGIGAVSKKEEAVLDELKQAFSDTAAE